MKCPASLPLKSYKAGVCLSDVAVSEVSFQKLYQFSFFDKFFWCHPSSIYSWSIGHILEHEFFCLGHLGCAGSKGKKKWIWVFLSNFWGWFFQLFEDQIFKKFCPQKVEKPTPKSCSEKLKSTSFPFTASTAQMAQTKEFMFQNMAYRPTVYRTGYSMKLTVGSVKVTGELASM